MSDPLRKVKPGEPVRLPAAAWNATADAARAERDRQRGRGAVGSEPSRLDAFVGKVLNNTGAGLLRGSVLGLDAPLILPADNLEGFLRERAFRGVAPTTAHRERFAVLAEPAAPGAIAKAWYAGVYQVRVNVVDEGHSCAEAKAGDTNALVSTAMGPVQILWREGGTGVQWAVVRRAAGCDGPYRIDRLPCSPCDLPKADLTVTLAQGVTFGDPLLCLPATRPFRYVPAALYWSTSVLANQADGYWVSDQFCTGSGSNYTSQHVLLYCWSGEFKVWVAPGDQSVGEDFGGSCTSCDSPNGINGYKYEDGKGSINGVNPTTNGHATPTANSCDPVDLHAEISMTSGFGTWLVDITE